jgi:hypothetical protein
MLNRGATPPEVMPSAYAPKPQEVRAAELDGIIGYDVKDFFPDTIKAIYTIGDDLSAIRKSAEKALKKVDMDKIRPDDTVNILCSEHGFGMMGGHPYAEMIKTIKDVVEEKTGCSNIRLRVSAWAGFKEAGEIIDYYKFDEYFDGKVKGVTPFDKGVKIETEFGTLYGMAKLYDADWFIHTHYDDPREIYAHRVIDRITKPFGMSYARFETRSIYHMSFGVRSGSFIGRVIFDSEFVQKKFAFASVIKTSPDGLVEVGADNNLNRLGQNVNGHILRSYGKMIRLLGEAPECIVVLDGGKWSYYIQAGGCIFGHLLLNGVDWFDLDLEVAWRSDEALLNAFNSNIKAIVMNQSLRGLFDLRMHALFPTIFANREVADVFNKDSANPHMKSMSVTANSLEDAVIFAKKIGQTENIIVFDGSYGHINMSPSMAEVLLDKAPEVNRVVDEELLPKWLKQRGIDPDENR